MANLGVAKTVLYHAPDTEHLKDLFAGFRQVDGCTAVVDGSPPYVTSNNVNLRFIFETDPCQAQTKLRESYFNMVLVDLRDLHGDGMLESYLEESMCFIESLATEGDIELRYGFHRVMALLSGRDNDQVDQLIAKLGKLGVGRIIRDNSTCRMCGIDRECTSGNRSKLFSQTVVNEAVRILTGRERGKRAICASGGGTTGLFFEMGALKCMDDCMSGDALNTFDMYFGISAGSIITGILSNGYSIDELMACVAGVEGGRIPPFSLSLLRLRHLNYRGYLEQFAWACKQTGRSLRKMIGRSKTERPPLLMEVGDYLVAPFHGGGFELFLRDLFRAPGRTNDFRGLKNPLYIGATDQDARAHRLFGEPGSDEVPISKAIQASMSINPAFAATPIQGRFYEDGAVTKTSNFVAAIEKGADLIFILDPFVPYVSKDPGFARRKGTLFNVDQDLRTVSYTRFENTRNYMLRECPHVSSYTFLPANWLRQLMSVNPLDHRTYPVVWRGAYLSTLKRIQFIQHRMAGDLAVHGIKLDTSRAEAVADRLADIEEPSLADFFPDRQVILRQPPIQHRSRASAWQQRFEPRIRAERA